MQITSDPKSLAILTGRVATTADGIARLRLHEALRGLGKFERWIICERYGLPDFPTPIASTRSPRRYPEMSRECGLSTFRIRQIEKTALNKLRRAIGDDLAKLLELGGKQTRDDAHS